MVEIMSLQNKAMLITLSISGWTARKQDKKVSAEVETAHNAKDAGRYNKLLVDKSYLDPLTQHAGKMRDYHYRMTLPWLDNGARLLPSKLFMEYRAEMEKLKTEYERLIDIFIREYDAKLVQDARVRLGTMYDPADYPSGYELRSKFSVETDIMPVPSGSDFRVDVGDAERTRIADELSERVAKRQALATASAWQRIRDTVGLVYARLSADKAVIRDSLIENTRELATLLPGLNIASDPVMEDVCQRIVTNLLVSPIQLRNSISFRRKIASEAQAILSLIPA